MKNENETFSFSGVYFKDSKADSEKISFKPGQDSLNKRMHQPSQKSPFSTCLIDHSGRQFVCFHEECIEHNTCFKKDFLNEMFAFQALHFHPDDEALLCEKLFPDILKYIDQIPEAELIDYRFSFNQRYIRKDGSISQFLQEGTLSISVDEGLPMLNLRVFTEIGDFKTDETMILSIFRYTIDQGYQKVYTKVYCNNDESNLSQREKEIIKLCLEGLSSKMIAARLNLSIHTVKNHKRNCMEKTLTHNITELIHLCIRSHWL